MKVDSSVQIIESLERVYMITLVSGIPESKDKIFWFGRNDLKDEMRPLKLVASDVTQAWLALVAHYQPAFEAGYDKAQDDRDERDSCDGEHEK